MHDAAVRRLGGYTGPAAQISGWDMDKKTQVVCLVPAVLALVMCAFVPRGAWAFAATVTTRAHLRAGPSIEYPTVTLLPPGVSV
jgi:uncharacterized protein YraI